MDIKSKASITVTANVSVGEVCTLVLDHVQAEVIKDAAGLTIVSRKVNLRDGGGADVELVYEKVDGAAAPVQPAADPTPVTPPAPLTGLDGLNLTPA